MHRMHIPNMTETSMLPRLAISLQTNYLQNWRIQKCFCHVIFVKCFRMFQYILLMLCTDDAHMMQQSVRETTSAATIDVESTRIDGRFCERPPIRAQIDQHDYMQCQTRRRLMYEKSNN